MANFLLVVIFAAALASVNSIKSLSWPRRDETSDIDEDDSDTNAETCVPVPLGGVAWLLSVRQKDFGWKEDTHRAVIVLAVNKWGPASNEDIRLMELQLEVELTKTYVKNSTTQPMYPNDLALYIHALIAIGRNPRNFFGIDWVSVLEKRVATSRHQVHPFLLLALCNADRVNDQYLHMAKNALIRSKGNNDIEVLAHALNTYECMGSRGQTVEQSLIDEARSKLIALQHKDGSFGNIYTTSLVVQALASADWDNRLALAFLKRSSTIDVNMVSTYYIQLALNADKCRFIKDLYPSDRKMVPAVFRNKEADPFVQYTIRNDELSDVYFTITMRRAPNSSFFDVMKRSALQDSKFNFSYNAGQDGKPVIYSISGVPNDIEDELSWKLCVQADVDHDRHVYTMITVRGSPANFFPEPHDHVLYWYRRTNCDKP